MGFVREKEIWLTWRWLYFWEVNFSICEKSNMLVSVSFSLKLVKMKVVTRLEMVVSTVTIHSARPALVAILSYPILQVEVEVSFKLLSIDLSLFLPDSLIDHTRKRLPKDCSSNLQHLLNYLKILWPLLPSCVWENPLENLPTLTN